MMSTYLLDHGPAVDHRHHVRILHRAEAVGDDHLGFDRIVASETEAPNMLANMV